MNTKKIIKVLEQFKNIDQDMSVSCALALLYASEENTQRDVETRLGLSNAAASRNVAYWTDYRKYQVEGQGMLDQFIDPEDRRYRRVVINAKGTAFLRQLSDILN